MKHAIGLLVILGLTTACDRDRARAPEPATAMLAVGFDREIVVYDLTGHPLRRRSSTPVEPGTVAGLYWPRADGPVVVRDAQDGVRWIDGTTVRSVDVPGHGRIDRVIQTAAGGLWLDRCVGKDDEYLKNEPCSEHGYFELPPGTGRVSIPPTRAPLPAVTAPSDVTLSTHSSPGPHGLRHELRCRDESGTRTIKPDAELTAPPTWRWISATPPIAIVELAFRDADEVAGPQVLRGCTLSDDAWSIVVGPDGLRAERIGDAWVIFRHQTRVAEIGGHFLVFAGVPSPL